MCCQHQTGSWQTLHQALSAYIHKDGTDTACSASTAVGVRIGGELVTLQTESTTQFNTNTGTGTIQIPPPHTPDAVHLVAQAPLNHAAQLLPTKQRALGVSRVCEHQRSHRVSCKRGCLWIGNPVQHKICFKQLTSCVTWCCRSTLMRAHSRCHLQFLFYVQVHHGFKAQSSFLGAFLLSPCAVHAI
jgi:hypothetical protein